MITSIAAGVSRIRSVDQPDVRQAPIVLGVAHERPSVGKHHVLSLLTGAIRGLLASMPPQAVRRVDVLIGWPAAGRPGAPAPPKVTALADCVSSWAGLALEPNRIHVVTGACAGAEALAIARARMEADAEIEACLVAAADSWLAIDSLRWAATRRPLRRSVHGDGMVPAEAGAAIWLARQAPSTAARLVGAASVGATDHPHPLDLAVTRALAAGRQEVDDVAHLVLDTDSERDAIVATASMSRGSGPRPWLGTRWFPAEAIGNVGAAAGLVGVMLASHVLMRHGEGGTAVCICCADTDNPVALVVSAPADPAASLEEPIGWAL